ncbi:MAG: ROK family protein, partial [Candidatus Dormibacteraceae bacterium]
MIAGIDLGGTQVRVAFARLDGQIQTVAKTKTILLGTPRHMVAWLADQVSRHGLVGRLKSVGIGAPGPVDVERGILVNPPNLPHQPNLEGWQNTHLGELLGTAMDCPIHLQNDATLAGWGEFHQGAGQGVRDMLYITWSTGVGGGLVLNGELYAGAHGSAGEVGHMVLDPQGPLCGCGQRGCLEAFCSGANVFKQYGKSAVELLRSSLEGDQEAREIIQRIAGHMGQGLVNLANLFDPELIVIGGGFTRSWGQLQPLLLAALRSSP